MMDVEKEARIRMRKVALDADVRDNSRFPKFIVVDQITLEYVACHSPSDLDAFPIGTMVYEPIEYFPYRFNKFFYDKNSATRLFYVAPPDYDSITWGSYITHFGDPLTFG